MAILIDESSRVVVQGITGHEGSFHARRNRAYGTRVVAGVTPGKGGRAVDGIPVYDTVTAAVDATAADVSLVFVPALRCADAIVEAKDAGIPLIVAITEGIPQHDMLRVVALLGCSNSLLIGPNGPGLISPGRASVGIMPTDVFKRGRVGLVSRSGTLTYEIAAALCAAGLGQSTAVGIGGDAVLGSTFVDILALFEDDPETDAVVLVGEIGGSDEERAAAFIATEMTKPVVAYIAGYTAPAGRRMGHAGAVISGTSGTAHAKRRAFEVAGVPVASSPEETAILAAQALSKEA